MKKNPLEAIQKNINILTNAQRKTGDYILQNPSEVVFLTINQLAKKVDTSTTTVMRFAANIGYSGYSELQENLKLIMIKKHDPHNRLEKNLKNVNNDQIWLNCVNSNIDKIKTLSDLLTTEKLSESIELITNAERIFCLGVRSGLPVSQYLSYGLDRSLGNCRLISPEEFIDEFHNITSKDLVIATSFPRYVKSLVKLIAAAKEEMNLKVLALTDSYYSPIVDYSDIVIPCNSDSLSFHNSPLAAIVVADYLISAVSINHADGIKERLSKSNSLLEDLNYHYGE